MVLPRAVARFNRHVTNPVAGLIAGTVPPFGVVVHKGRKSGRAYRTPVWVFEDDGVYRIALTYGRDAEWVKNVVAAGGFQLEARGRTLELTDPVVLEDRSAGWAPIGIRQVLRSIAAKYYLQAGPVG
ncbi:nitroreductase family deazaflavin-dependent oxidoreductase [Nocardia amikacinitolerans]|uniref:nitroreductase family deazaflavin-dependent oxidoreductase n=1 Tax=Nocardia amikacinitolerans TaxID=756689 RepID=UPI0020A4F732|nr:nitroreductase family deazaflavin-dependent oxidoreductase [Nocardia amikacinitolerans]MCP2277934.1 deazaflavin-dependent oxidoreductase, nitroreductase family [Nocardia amikacinitolerans]MCP2288262.1 deazaflavin-dependent oxidoreductase, nitroreductase family [Nocardia amikacinitolerans]